MASINCPRCGAPIDASSKFCGNCGYSPQTGGTATSHPLQGQAGGGHPSSYPTPSSPTNPSDGKPLPTYLADQTSSSAPTYRVDGSPLSPLSPYPPNNNSPSAYTYPAAGAPPPPPFPVSGGTPSSPTYSTSGANFPSAASSNSSANYQTMASSNSEPPSPPPPRRRGNAGFVILSIIALIVILAGAGLYVVYGTSLLKGKTAANPTATANTQGNTTTTPTVAPTTTSSTGVTPTVTTTSSTDTSTTPTVSATNPTTSTNSYTAIQPGPGCDTNGGTWTPQDIERITCGTQLYIKGTTRGYLYLQLPNNKAFSASNIIGISGTVQSDNSCIGLAEQGATTGLLAEYCGNGDWAIYSISSGGAIVQTLAKSVTSTRSTEQLSLTLKDSTLSFSIDTEVHTINITPIQPTRVAVTSYASYYDSNETVTNFSYTAM